MKSFHLAIAFLMLVTGSINTIVTKYADEFCSKGLEINDNCTYAKSNIRHCIPVPAGYNSTLSYIKTSDDAQYCKKAPYMRDKPDTELATFRKFNHPFVQAFTMFIGEFCCLLAFKIIYLFSRKKDASVKSINDDTSPPPPWNPIIWALPALCDSGATTSMYVGLTYTDASSFQMLRGSVVIFTGILSLVWLKKKLVAYHWAGMVLVLVGLLFVGLAGFLQPKTSSASNPILGDVIIIVAQVVVAVQMVLEEKLMTKYRVPVLCAVGWEGFFGMFYMVGFSFLFTYTASASVNLENLWDCFMMLSNSLPLCLVFLGTICSIAFFNFSGLMITKVMSATTRMVLDSVRTVVIFVVSISAPQPYGGDKLQKVNKYSSFQVVGFIILLLGTFVYNEKEVGDGILDVNGKPRMESLIAPLLRSLGILKPRPTRSNLVVNERSALLADTA